MICSNNYLADFLRVSEIKDLIWVMRFQSPLVYILTLFSLVMTCLLSHLHIFTFWRQTLNESLDFLQPFIAS